MKKSNRWITVLVSLALMLMAQNSLAVTCTSVATTQTDWNKTAAWDAACGGQPPVGATVIIANGTNILADANTLNVMNVTVQAGGILAIRSGNTVSLSGNFTNNGTFTAPAGSTVALTGTNQTITGNVTFANLTVAAGTQLTLVGNITITGTTNLATTNIVSTCPTNYTITNQTTGTVQNSCATAGGGGGGAAACIPTTTASGATPIMAGAGQLTYGNGTTVNGGGGAVAVTGANNAIPVTGGTVIPAPTMPALPATPFPLAAGGTVNNATTVAAGTYGTINATGNPTIFTGGTYYINNLNTTGPIQLAAGTYYINTLNLKGNLTVTGAVTLYIGNQIDLKATGISLNAGGNAGNLQVNLYSGAQFDAGVNNASFTGLIYSPFANSQVQFNNNATINGAVITAGQVQLGNNATINYTPTIQSQLSATTCSTTTVDHFLISHPSTGLTCSTQAVTVAACGNAACTTYVSGISVTLQPGGAVVTTSAAGAVASTVAQATAGVATLTATSATAAAGATQCANTTTGAAASAAACTSAMTFNTAGFVITAPNHVSCTNSAVTIEAVQQGAVANRCVPAYANVTRAVNLNIAYTNPATGTKTLTDVTNNLAITTAASAHNLTFDAAGTATLSVSYPDVGQVTLTASDTAPTGAAMTGSDFFIAAPSTFAISGVTAGPIKAGNNFAATVTAQTGTGAACAVAAAAPNFGKETVAEGVTLSFSKCQPTGINSSNGAFSGNVGAFTNGVASAANLNWSEVGNGDLVATLTSGSYLGSALTATGNTGTGGTACTGAGNVGAFIPDHFTTSIINGCLGCGFTYSGQPFTASITAMNGLATPTTTVNYDGTANTTPNFANNVTLTDANALATPVGKLGVSAAALGVTANVAGTTLTVPKADFTKGVATLTSVPTYTFNTVTTAPTTIKMHVVDAVNATVTSSVVEGTAEIRSGRIKVSNANGSEQLPLTLTATAQYYSGTAWLTSTTDSATSFNTNLAAAGNIVQSIIKGPLTGITVAGPGVTTLAGGITSFKLNKPGVSGVVDISVNAPSYLSTSGVTGRATFGVYKGTKEFIYLREAY